MGIDIDVKDTDYQKAKKELKSTTIRDERILCVEDVWVQILRSGKPLQFYDNEKNEQVEFTIEQAVERLGMEEALLMRITKRMTMPTQAQRHCNCACTKRSFLDKNIKIKLLWNYHYRITSKFLLALVLKEREGSYFNYYMKVAILNFITFFLIKELLS